MKRVLAQGAFNVLLPSHLHYLRESKTLGDSLWVAVTPDSARCDHVIQVDQSRREMVESLKPVDTAVIGTKTDVTTTLNLVEPDIVALREDMSDPEWIDYFETKTLTDIEVVWIDSYRSAPHELTTLQEIKARCQARRR
jgi:FAD synthetase